MAAGEAPHHLGVSALDRERMVHGINVCLDGDSDDDAQILRIEPVESDGLTIQSWFMTELGEGVSGVAADFDSAIDEWQTEHGVEGDTVSTRCGQEETGREQIAVILSPTTPGETALISGFDIVWAPSEDPDDQRTSYYPAAVEMCPVPEGSDDPHEYECVGDLPARPSDRDE